MMLTPAGKFPVNAKVLLNEITLSANVSITIVPYTPPYLPKIPHPLFYCDFSVVFQVKYSALFFHIKYQRSFTQVILKTLTR